MTRDRPRLTLVPPDRRRRALPRGAAPPCRALSPPPAARPGHGRFSAGQPPPRRAAG
ncbi:hypothetical protein [Pseudoroseomonas cervicalis]|uniref:hypothetical protein n=1 Tax=Teichococcus cervicalis TaxID=204525 RepID=UPI0022F1CFB4|nr:hypothetical protein [Pseudoroseomonas cervicalis]WBV44440.1 hypothetical protein PFY06_07730 [Pseudoroseomonas cervicalis]